MDIKKIEVGKWYETKLGLGKCVRAGGTFPPSVQIDLRLPYPRGVVNMVPRDVLKEVLPPN